MNENLDLVEILKDCPSGISLYSPVYGYVQLASVSLVEGAKYPIEIIGVLYGTKFGITKDGRIYEDFQGECMLFPSKEQRDWSKFKVKKPKFKVGDRIRHKETNKDDVYEISKVYDDSYGIAGFTWMIYKKYQDQYELVPNKFDPTTLKPFDKVLVRDSRVSEWRCEFYSHTKEIKSSPYKYCTTSSVYECCIPYNEETKHLIGTKDEAPEYYRYWKD